MKFLSALIVMGVAACSYNKSYEQSLEEWQGQNVAVLYEEWGQPQSTQNLPNGAVLVEYSQSQQQTTPPQTMEGAPEFSSSSFFDNQQTYFCQTTFTINNGIITDYEFEGDNCNN